MGRERKVTYGWLADIKEDCFLRPPCMRQRVSAFVRAEVLLRVCGGLT